MTSYLLSWLRAKFGASDVEPFERLHPHDWLVWEAGPWYPPERATGTLVGSGETQGAPGAGEPIVIALQRDSRRPYVTIGRGKENDVAVDDATLSRVHLVLMRPESGGWTVRDAGSSNGTYLEGRLLETGKPALLASGTHLQAGSVRLTFLESRDLLLRLRT